MLSPRLPASLREGWNRTRVLAVVGAVLVLVAVLILALTLGGSSDPDPAASASTTTPARSTAEPSAPGEATSSPGASPSPAPSGTLPPADPNAAPPSLPAVALDATSDAGGGITGKLTAIEGIDSRATGPGNVAGPALRVTVQLHNGGQEAVSLEGVAVNLAYGADRTPGSPLQDSSASPFTGSLPPGDTAEGVYVFSVPSDARDQVTVEVGWQPGAPLMIFAGRVG